MHRRPQTSEVERTMSGNANGTKAGTSLNTNKKKGDKKKAAPPESHRCFHCETESTKMMCCSQCHRAWYCGRPCQKKHWKQHKRACTAALAAQARRATLRREATAARGGSGVDRETCVICVGPVVAPVELPCGHAYCGACLAELRTKKVAQTCPMCRESLPPGLNGLFELAWRAYVRIQGMVNRGEVSWASLPAAQQEEIEESVAMLTEAAAQGHSEAGSIRCILAFLLENVWNDFDGAIAEYRMAIEADPSNAMAYYNLSKLLWCARKDVDSSEAACRAAIALDPGFAKAHISLGGLMRHGRDDVDGAEAAFRVAIAADPGYAEGYLALGALLENDRNDIDGAEAAYRAAIAAAPGRAMVHIELGVLLSTRRNDFDGAEAAYRAAIAADPNHARAHWSLGTVLHKTRRDIDGAEAAYRAAIAADPGYAVAHSTLGILLEHERKDIDGAKAAYRATIKADPDEPVANQRLANLSKRKGKGERE